MFDIGWTEMLVIGVIAIVVVGPKDLPALLRGVGRIVRQMRGLAREFQGGVEEFIREAELDEVKKSIHHVSNFDPTSHPDFRPDANPDASPDTNSASKPEPAADTPEAGATQKGKVEKGDAEKSKAGKTKDAGAKQKKQSAEKSGSAGEDGKGDGG